MRFHNDPNQYVAHYTSGAVALDHILPEFLMRLGPLSKTNDPRESKMWQFGLGASWNSEHSLSPGELKKLVEDSPTYDKLLRYGCRILCVSEDAENASKQNISDRAYGKPRMWAQYGENHRGVCFILDKEALHKTILDQFGSGAVMHGKVDYGDFHNPGEPGWFENQSASMLSADNLVQHGIEKAFSVHREKFGNVFSFRKNRDWQSESEYRWIVSGDSNEPLFIPVGESLRAIVLGIDFPIHDVAKVLEYCIEKDLWLARITWTNGMPGTQWFEPERLRAEYYNSCSNSREALEFNGLLSCEEKGIADDSDHDSM